MGSVSLYRKTMGFCSSHADENKDGTRAYGGSKGALYAPSRSHGKSRGFGITPNRSHGKLLVFQKTCPHALTLTPDTCARTRNNRYVPDGLTSSPHPQCSTRKAVDAVVSPWPSQEPHTSVQKLRVSFAVLLGGVSSLGRLLLQLQRQGADSRDRLVHLLALQRQMK